MRRRERLHILVPCAVGPSRALHDQPLLSAEPLRLLHVPAVSPTLCVQHIAAHVSKAGHYTSTSRHAASRSGVYVQRKTRERQEKDKRKTRFRAVLTHCHPSLSGTTNPGSNAEKWPIVMQFAVRSVAVVFVPFEQLLARHPPLHRRAIPCCRRNASSSLASRALACR